MPVSGSFDKLAQMRARLGKMVGVPERVATAVAPAVKGLVNSEFVSKTDPYGGAWKGDKAKTFRRGTKSILVRSGRMRDEIDIAPFGAKLKVILGTFYARFHISTGRRTLPMPGKLPPSWSTLIEHESKKALHAIASGAR